MINIAPRLLPRSATAWGDIHETLRRIDPRWTIADRAGALWIGRQPADGAMRQREMTSTYIIVLGIEAITALLLGMALLNESLTPIKIGESS